MSRSEKVIGKEFELLKSKTVTVVGVGGTGCSVAQLLSRLPIKKLILIDGDSIDESNLERQFLYSKEDVGKKKVIVAKEKLKGMCDIESHPTFIAGTNVDFTGSDLIIDCTDNLKSRFVINDWCKQNNVPWIYTGAVGSIGNVLFVSKEIDFGKIFANKEGETCCRAGVLSTLVSLIGSLAVKLAVDYLTSGTWEKKMIRVNAQKDEFMKISV